MLCKNSTVYLLLRKYLSEATHSLKSQTLLSISLPEISSDNLEISWKQAFICVHSFDTYGAPPMIREAGNTDEIQK